MFIDSHREASAVEPICRVLAIAPSAYDVYRQRQADSTRSAPQAQRRRWAASEMLMDGRALADSVIGLSLTEVIRRLDPWRGFEDVEDATFERVAWFHTQRVLEPVGYLHPSEFEE